MATELAGKYRVEKLIGEGGMAKVYRAENTLVGRPVAIKVMRPEVAQNEQLVQRFLREARAANIVRHPNVADVLDIGQDEDGTPFIVQELLEGEDLATAVEKAGGQLSIELTLRYMLPIIEAVAEGHTKGVVHRDLKPENIFLAHEGRNVVPKLLDFGISHVKTLDKRLTAAGQAMGTPAYMSPEQVMGAEIDARADVWSLGVILQELLSGELPFGAESVPVLLVAIVSDAPRPLADDGTPGRAEMAAIVGRALRREPADRYPSAAEMLRELRRVWRALNLGRYGHSLPSEPPPSVDSAPPRLAPARVAPPPPATPTRLPSVPDLVLPARGKPPPPKPAPRPPPPPAGSRDASASSDASLSRNASDAGDAPHAPPRPPPPRVHAADIELATARPRPVRVASAPRPDPTLPTVEDIEARRGAIAWLWLVGSIALGATVGRVALSAILTDPESALRAMTADVPTIAVVVLLSSSGLASWRALRAFRDGDRSAGVGMGALAGLALLVVVQITL